MSSKTTGRKASVKSIEKLVASLEPVLLDLLNALESNRDVRVTFVRQGTGKVKAFFSVDDVIDAQAKGQRKAVPLS